MNIPKNTLLRKASLVTWADVHTEVNKVNPELAKIIDQINPDQSYRLVKIEYPYGDIMVENGISQIPSPQGELESLIDGDIDPQIKKELSYREMPLFLILENSCEVFVDAEEKIVPLNLFYPGALMGVYETMDFMSDVWSDYPWNFSAGSRSIIMLPWITDITKLNKVCAELEIPAPSSISIKNLTDHWHLFRAIAQSKKFSQPWKCTVLYFGKKWLEVQKNSKAWHDFKDFLVKDSWRQVHYVLSKFRSGFEWRKYAEAITFKRLRPPPYLYDHVKHILATAVGNYPAFIPIDNSQKAAPTDGIKNIIVDIYGLEKYIPSMMHVSAFNLKPEQPIYYSLSLPTLLEGSTLKTHRATIKSDVRKIKQIIDAIFKHVTRKKDWEDDVLHNTKFEYFHTEDDKFHEIKASDKITQDDPNLLKNERPYPDRKFCDTSLFFRGCIRMIRKIMPFSAH